MQQVTTQLLLLTTFLLSLVQAQSTDNLICSTPYQRQAIGSSLVVSCTCVPRIPSFLNLDWRINNMHVGSVGFTIFLFRRNGLFSSQPSDVSPRPNLPGFDLNRVNTSVSGSRVNFTAQLTLRNLKLSDNGVKIQLSWPLVTNQSILVNVSDCSSRLPFKVSVSSSAAVFQALGTFACLNNGELFYSNGSMLTTTDTVCLASAEWSGQENLQCWSALVPTLMFGKSLTLIEGSNLTLNCDYMEVIPLGYGTRFYIGDVINSLTKGESLTLRSVGRNDNNKIISCQALTPYTRIRGNAGRSLNYSLDVQYTPYQDETHAETWKIDQVGNFNITFKSNPQSKYVSLAKNGILVTNDISNKISSFGDLQIFQFMRRVVSFADEGKYALTVQSSAFPNNYTIFFDVDVVDSIPAKSKLSLIIGVSCAAAVLVILLSIVVILITKKRRSKTIKVITEQAQRIDHQPVANEPGYIEVNQENLPVQRIPKAVNIRYQQHEIHDPLTDENGYFELNQPSNKEFHVYVNTKEAKEYENVEETCYEAVV